MNRSGAPPHAQSPAAKLVFIHESGDAGLKLDSGSTDYFIVILVAFEGNDGALATDRQIEGLKARLGFPVPFEFNKVQGEYRKASLSAVAGSGWVPDAHTPSPFQLLRSGSERPSLPIRAA